MKWLLRLVLVLSMITPAFAGEDPYIAIVGNDGPAAIPFYFSPKCLQFMYDQEAFGIPVCDGSFPSAYNVAYHPRYNAGCEQFRSQMPVNQAEVCDTYGIFDSAKQILLDGGQPNAVTRAGNTGWYEWYVRLPKKPSGQINLVLQCGVLKPSAFSFFEYESVYYCAAETGERIGPGLCVRQEVEPGTNPLRIDALPKITAKAIAGPYNSFDTFNLTAFRNPGAYNPFGNGIDDMVNGGGAQLLNGSDTGTRILLKSCMDETVVTKLPVTGQVNAAGQQETDLEAGDLIYVRIDIPRANTVDIYCHEQSLKVMGIGESPF